LQAHVQGLRVGALVGPQRATDRPAGKASDVLRKCLGTRVRPRLPRLPPRTNPRRSKGKFAQRHHRSHPHAHTSRPRSPTLTVGEEAPPLPGPARASYTRTSGPGPRPLLFSSPGTSASHRLRT
ncbi:hypothetical protein K523DRAFT_391894, partial [Schizophyllum commune Tattone D]